MNTNYWSTTNQAAVRNFLGDMEVMARSELPNLVLPSPGDITGSNPDPLTNSRAPILGMAVTGSTFLGKAAVKVGTRIFVRDYQGTDVATGQHKCPFPRFADCVLRDLRQIATTISGQRLLRSLDAHGGAKNLAIVFCPGVGGDSSQCNQLPGKAPNALTGQTPGAGVTCIVKYNPLYFGLPKVTGTNARDREVRVGAWGHPAQKPADVTLFHELIHADDMLRGIFDQTQLRRGSRDVKISELRAVGLDLFDNSSMYTENSYRAERGFVERPFYGEYREVTKRGPRVTPAYQGLVTYLDKELMSRAAFVRASRRHVGKRNKILAVEVALVRYNREYAWKENPAAKQPGLIKLLKAVVAYKEKSKSKRNVSTLLAAIGGEIKAGIEGLLALPISSATFQKIRRMAMLLARASSATAGKQVSLSSLESVKLVYRDKLGNLQHNFSPRMLVEGYQSRLSPAQILAVQADDQADLLRLSQDLSTAQITRDVITELLGIANSGDVNFTDTRAGSSAGFDPGPKTYRVEYGQWNFDDLRLSTLVHELTHVANLIVFQGTPLMVSYDPVLAEDALRTLLAARKLDIEGLLTQANDVASGFTPYQLLQLTNRTSGKLPYAILNANASSLSNLKNAPNGSVPIYDVHVKLALADQLTRAAYEYETVLNQILIYMRVWDIPQTNAFHARVMVLAQAAYDERQRLLALRAPVVVPAPPPRRRLQRSKSTGDLLGGSRPSRRRSGSVKGKKSSFV